MPYEPGDTLCLCNARNNDGAGWCASCGGKITTITLGRPRPKPQPDVWWPGWPKPRAK